jgi:tryptophan synthase beta chain
MPENYFKKHPDKDGFFNEYGGAFIPPVLEVEMKKINDAYFAISKSHNLFPSSEVSASIIRGGPHLFIIATAYRRNMEHAST